MEVNVLNSKIKSQFVKAGLCKDWQESWKGDSYQSLIDMYIDVPKFGLERKVPTMDLLEEFPRDLFAKSGVYNSQSIVDFFLRKPQYIFNDCAGDLHIGGFDISNAHLSLDSDFDVYASGYSKLIITLYQDAKVRVRATDKANVSIYCDEGNLDNAIIISGNVKIKKKKK